MPTFFSRWLTVAVVVTTASLPLSAQAWWRGGVWIAVPPVVVGPAYYPPPYYPPAYYPPAYPGYYPPPVYAPPPEGYSQPQPPQPPQSSPQAQANAAAPRDNGQANVPYGSICYAGIYHCAAPPYSHVGSDCSCPGLGAPSYGTVN